MQVKPDDPPDGEGDGGDGEDSALPEEGGDGGASQDGAAGGASEPIAEAMGDAPDDWAFDEVMKCGELGYIYGDLLGGYQNNISRIDFCEVLFNVLKDRDAALVIKHLGKESPFTDADVEFATALNSLGIIMGVGEGLFNPDGDITRQEAAVMLRRAAVAFGADEGGEAAEFSDKDTADDWALEGIDYVVEMEIMRGVGGGLFDPLGNYTRQQAYLTMVRLANVVPDANFQEDLIGA